ncbi:hypothetical protein QL093DRAFT_1003238 [Fusarium oxysporum]|nr:hypothetical protein QL093DRAFT_1003238 [Fusarium oxysporum]
MLHRHVSCHRYCDPLQEICVISFCNCPRPLVAQAPCMLFNVQPTSSCRQPCHIGYTRRYDCNP